MRSDEELARIAAEVERIAAPQAFRLLCWMWHEREDENDRSLEQMVRVLATSTR